MMMDERAMMLKKVQAACFALYDIQLFLDTHPTDRGALECYAKYQKIYEM
ncbi:MAG: spore coat protein CotJB [Lachnospiraceae bacterium]|nr:spore coat protein CotJB [Lachnospiraceae bacterium]